MMPTLNQLLIAEATEYDFKSAVEIKKPRSWLKTVSAFANGIGGSIYFGVSDDGAVTGLDNPQQSTQKISEFIKARIEPAIKNIVFEPLRVDGGDILRVHISGGANTPYYYVGDGNKVAYYRLGNESVSAPAAIVNELILKGLNQTFDALETKYIFSDYSYTLFEATYKQKTGNTVDKPRDYHSFGMLTAGDALTFVGALFADQCPVYQSRIFCTRWNGLKKGGLYIDALDNDEFNGGVISLLNDALKFVRHNSSVKWKKTGTGRIEMLDYPPEAVHEALVNALVHRDYLIQGSEIHVDMFDDRLEIVSPGGMPDGKRIQDLSIDDIASIRRNPVICDVFSRLKLMERRGSGLRKMVDEYPNHAAPAFRSTEQSFIVILKNLNNINTFISNGVDDDINNGLNGLKDDTNNGLNGLKDDTNNGLNGIKDDTNNGLNGLKNDTNNGLNGLKDDTNNGLINNIKIIYNAIQTNPKITQHELSLLTGLSVRTITRKLKRLRDTGAIVRVGSKRAGFWQITP